MQARDRYAGIRFTYRPIKGMLSDPESFVLPAGEVTANEHLVRFRAPGAELVVFKDGRAIVKNAKDAAQARSLYARYVGA